MNTPDLLARIEALEARVAALEPRPHLPASVVAIPPKRKPGRNVQAECLEASAVTVPERLSQNNAFMQTWMDFCEHREKLATIGTVNKKKFPWTARAAKGILNKCLNMGTALAIEALNTSMEREWADVFEPKDSPQNGAKPKQESVWHLKQSLEAINDQLGKLDDQALYDGATRKLRQEQADLKERRHEINRKIAGLT